jgi:hypothetical protein
LDKSIIHVSSAGWQESDRKAGLAEPNPGRVPVAIHETTFQNQLTGGLLTGRMLISGQLIDKQINLTKM